MGYNIILANEIRREKWEVVKNAYEGQRLVRIMNNAGDSFVPVRSRLENSSNV